MFFSGIVTTTMSPARAASWAVAARARGPSSLTSADSVAGPRELLTTTSYPFLIARRATWLPMCPAPMSPMVVIATTYARRRAAARRCPRQRTTCAWAGGLRSATLWRGAALALRGPRAAHELARPVEADQVPNPGKGRHVGDRVVVAREPGMAREARIENLEQALGFCHVTIARPLVLEVFTGELVEKADLPEHRPHAPHLEHQPLDGLVALCPVPREELPALVGEVDEDRPRLEQRQRLAAGAVGIDDCRDLAVRVERLELRRQLILAVEADEVRLVRKRGLFEQDRHFHPVGSGQPVQLNAIGVPGRPLLGDGKVEQVGHRAVLLVEVGMRDLAPLAQP